MSKWLALARGGAVPIVPIAPKSKPEDDFGDFGNFGTTTENEPGKPTDAHFGDFGNIGTTALVSPEEVRALFEWTANRLVSDHGRETAAASKGALPIVRASLVNDPRLCEPQTVVQCFVCGGGDRQDNSLVAVLSAHPGRPHWVHLRDCHAEHCRRQGEKADDCLRAAGLHHEEI